MEVVKELKKPYTEKNRLDFIVEYSHNKGLKIIESETSIQALDYTKEEKEKIKKEEINNLSMTKREAFLGLYKALNITPEDIKKEISTKEAEIEFEYAENYFRGNPLINLIGKKLGITEIQLDNFFKTKDYKELIKK